MTHTSLLSRPLSGVRFAPSPTGRFHIGNLRTAWISRQLARAFGEPWIVRFEDIDAPRVMAGALQSQLEDMKKLGLHSDITTIQSDFHSHHHELFVRAATSGQAYPCDCSRKEVQSALSRFASAPHGVIPPYSGTCRGRDLTQKPLSQQSETWAWRFRMNDPSGTQDFIVARTKPASGLEPKPEHFAPSYHWACAIDDHRGAYSLLVRAWDLESSAQFQRAIQSWLCRIDNVAEQAPAIFHTSLVVDNTDQRLEKRSRGVTLPELAFEGRSPEQIIAAFEHSWVDRPKRGAHSAGVVMGETRRTLRLSELGLVNSGHSGLR